MVTLGVGQRTDILVKAIGKPTDAVWMRSDISGNCSLSHQPHAFAAIYYESADKTQEPTTTATTYSDSFCGNVSTAQAPENDRILTQNSNNRTHWTRLFHFSPIPPWVPLQQQKKLISISSKTIPATGNGPRMTNTSEPITSMSNFQYREHRRLKTVQRPAPPPRQPRKHILPSRLQHLQLRLQHLHPHRLIQRNPCLPPHAPPWSQFLGRSRRRRRMERHRKLHQSPKARHADPSSSRNRDWAGVSGVGIQR